MIRFTPKELDVILADFLGKPYKRMATGPDAYDCYGLVKAFMSRIGVDIPEIGKVDPADSRPVYEQQQMDYVRLDWPRPWSLVTFSGKDLNAHIGVVLPNDNLFLHCPGRAAGKVIAEPLSRRPWRDTIDGYWWPRNYLETILMLTPMTTKRAWQFVRCDGRTLRQIIEQDITEDVQVQAFLEGELVDPADWDLVPGPVNQLVIRPIMGEGEQALMIGGMLALAAFAPWAAGALNEGLALGLGKVGLGMLQAGVMMGGALALNALVGPGEGSKNASQHYTWEPQTTQRVGSFIPLVYGTYGVRGNIICSYATSEITTKQNPFNKETQVDSARDLYWLKIAYSDGPIHGIIEGTERLNGKDPQQYADSDDFVLEHFTGTDDQAASSVPDAFEIPVNKLCDDPSASPNEVVATFTAVKCDRAAVVLRFPNGFTNYSADGDHNATSVDVTVRIRESGGTWHTLSDGEIWGDTTKPVRIHRWFNETYEGGSPFTLVAGTTYEVGVTRNDSRHSDHGDDFYFDCIQCAFSTAQKHPGLAYTAIGAAASKDISGAIDYYAKIKGKLVRVYDDATETWSIEWSDNPAWVAYDVLTRPIIKGNGTTVPYAVESYRRLDPSYLILDDFVALADWCDTTVPDGAGGTEKRFVFNGVFDEEGSAWEQAIRVLRSACAMPYFRGNKIGVVIDKPGTPVQMFNVSNLREGFSETWIDTSEAATVYDAEFYDENADYGAESWPVPLLGAENDIPASLDCFGHTKRSRVWRYASRQLRVNQYMKRMVEIPACLDAIYTNLGDIVYVQHPSLQRATGGRIVAVYADGVKVDKPVPVIPAAVAHWKLNETSGTAVADASGNGHTGTASRDTSAMTTTGKINGALNFNGTDDYVNIPDHVDLRLTGGGTIMAWIKPDSLGETAGRIVDKSTNTAGANGYLFTIGSSGKLTFQASGGTSISVDGAMSYGEWLHVAVTFDGVRARFYVNGVLVSDQAYTTLPPNVAGDVRIGQRAGATDRTFDGAIDDVRIYDTALTPAQIALVYNDGDGTEGLPNYALLIRTHDGTAERLTLYEVVSVSGDDDDIVTISGTWEYTPDVNDLWTFGEEVKVIDLYRVKGFERTGNGQVLIQAAQYTTDYYTDDEEAPKIEAKTYSQTKGGIAPSLLPTTAQAVAAERLEAVSAVDTLAWEGLSFTGNGVDKVTWTCSGAGIKYQGTWCPIYADAAGTTDKYIYFDPAIGDPRYLQHTNNLADLAGYERYVFCINDGGVAYFQPGKLMSSQDVKLDAIDHVVQFFYQATEPTSGMVEGDYWQDSDDKKWHRYSGSAWVDVQDTDIVAALNAATTAEAIADGRIVTHRGSAPPLVGHWKLNDTTGTTVVDATGNGHDGTPSADASTLTTTGKINAGFNLGGSDYVTVADHADLSAFAAGSWCVWFKTSSSSQQMLLSKFGSGYEWYLYQQTSGKIGLHVLSSNGTAIYMDIVTTAAFNDGEWHHIVAVWDGSLTSDGLFLYVDGEEVAVTRSSAGTFVSIADSGEDVVIGALGNYTQGWNGQIDDVRIYSRALTYGEALKLYNRGGGTEEVKVPDRGDLWIKTSEDNKPYQWTGSAWQAAGYDVATWAKIVGTGKPDDYADVTADSPILTFRETFENPNDDYVDKWTLSSWAADVSIVEGAGVAGGNVLQAGDNSGNDSINLRYHKYIPYDPTKLYRLRVRIKQTAGTGTLYFGVMAFTATLVSNQPTGYTAHWVTAMNEAVPSDWTVYTGYFSGLSASANGQPGVSPGAPAPLKENTTYFKPFAHLNYAGGGTPGIVFIDEIVIDVLPEDADQIAESSTKKWAGESGADVTSAHQGDINIDNIQDGSSYKKLSAANLTALQSAINMDTPQPRSGWEGAFTNNSPSAGYVAWTSFVIRYQGTDYTVAASNSNSKYLYWNAGATKTQLYASNAIADALGTGKFIVGYNESGTFYPAQFIKIIHGALIQAATILAEHLSVSQLSAIVADLGEMTAGTITLNLGGTNRLRISPSGIQGSDDSGSTWYNIITTDGGKVVLEGDVVKAGTIIADAVADDELTVFRSVNTAASVAFSTSSYATIQSRSFPASGGVVHLTIQVQLKTDSGSGDVVNWQILRGTTEIVSGTQAITNAWKTYAFSCIDLPSSGSYTYYFKVKGVVADGDAQNRIMYCEEAIK